MGVPMILDLIISSSRQSCCNFGPPIAKARMEINNKLLFIMIEETSFQVGPEVICPAESTTLAAAAETGELRDCPPAVITVSAHEIH